MADKILIVDDDPDTVRYLSLFLTRLGYEPLQARDGVEALQAAHEKQPQLIVLDVMMPGMDGYEVARNLRRHPDTALIPILMFTAKIQMEDKLAGYESGVDIYLTKPIHPVELQANLKALLSQHKTRAATAHRAYVVGVLAAKGGLGVSTVALNLAIVYRQVHKGRVIAAEMRPGQGAWSEELGFSNVSGLTELLHLNRTEITSAVVEKKLSTNTLGVPLLLASDSVCESECMSALAQYEAIVEGFRYLADLVVLDIGTNFHPAYEVFTSLCDEMVVVTEPQPLAVKRTCYLVADLKSRDFGSARGLTVVTVNRSQSEMRLTASNIEDALGQGVALDFPYAPELAYQAITHTTPMYLAQPGGIIARQFETLVEQISTRVSHKATG
jgi:CheY-like chemotaxis protein/MinD-like ATPase involved in chromosome partitioning or flagellar assembly